MSIISFNPPRAYISGTGYNVPARVVGNDYFASYLETSDEWIRDRTGIAERRWVAPEESASSLALPACQKALVAAGISPAEVDGIIVATCTADYVFPSTACVLQHKLGIAGCLAFDVNAVCSGFLYALSVASSMMSGGVYRNLLVVGVDLFSRIIDKQDRSTCILFGDGAGAVVLSRTEEQRGILSYELGADGSMGDLLCVKKGSAREVSAESLATSEHYLSMNGREIFKLAVRAGVESGQKLCSAIGIMPSDIDYMVFHQANQRILAAVGKQLGLSGEQVLSNVERYGNTSAASIPLLMAEFFERGVLKPGQLILLGAFGGGVTWGGMLLRL
jgi:3-oxoacyl-[acyl-carrier-protein] synthase-3